MNQPIHRHRRRPARLVASSVRAATVAAGLDTRVAHAEGSDRHPENLAAAGETADPSRSARPCELTARDPRRSAK